MREALSLGHDYIGTEHILLGLVRENEGVAARILLDFDADDDKIRNAVMRMLSLKIGRGRAPANGAPWIMVYCPSCDAPVESIGTEMVPGRFGVEGDGAQTCRSCGASLAPELPRGVEDGRGRGRVAHLTYALRS